MPAAQDACRSPSLVPRTSPSTVAASLLGVARNRGRQLERFRPRTYRSVLEPLSPAAHGVGGLGIATSAAGRHNMQHVSGAPGQWM